MDKTEVSWSYGGSGEMAQSTPKKRVPYAPTWANFEKLSDEEKKKQYTTMRGELIANGLMEDKQ